MGIFTVLAQKATVFLQQAEIWLYKRFIFNGYAVPKWIANFFSQLDKRANITDLILNGEATLENDLVIWRKMAHLGPIPINPSQSIDADLKYGLIYSAYIKMQMGTKVVAEIKLESLNDALDVCRFLKKYDSKNKFIPWKSLATAYLNNEYAQDICNFLRDNVSSDLYRYIFEEYSKLDKGDKAFNEFIKACIMSNYPQILPRYSNYPKAEVEILAENYTNAKSKEARIMLAKWCYATPEMEKHLLQELVTRSDMENSELMQYFAKKVGIFKLQPDQHEKNDKAIARAYYILSVILKKDDKLHLAHHVLNNMGDDYYEIIKLIAFKKDHEVLRYVMQRFEDKLYSDDWIDLRRLYSTNSGDMGMECVNVIRGFCNKAETNSRVDQLGINKYQFLNILNDVNKFNPLGSTTLLGAHYELVKLLAGNTQFKTKWCDKDMPEIGSNNCNQLLKDIEAVKKGQPLTI